VEYLCCDKSTSGAGSA